MTIAADRSSRSTDSFPGAAAPGALAALRWLGAYRLALALALTAWTMADGTVADDAAASIALVVLQWGLAGQLLARLRCAGGVGPGELQLQVMLDLALLACVLAATGSAAVPFVAAGLLPMVVLARAGAGRLPAAGLPAVARRRPPNPTAASGDGVQAERAAAAPAGGVDLPFAVVVGGLAHDLASPLATVAVVSAELQRDYADDPRLQADLALIETQLGACRAQLSLLTRTCVAGCEQPCVPQPLGRFVAGIADGARARWPGTALAVDCAAPELSIRSPLLLAQTLGNLLDNAARASPGGLELRVSVVGERVRFEVNDRGPGFDPEMLSWLGSRPLERPGSPARLGCGLVLGALAARILGGTLELGNRVPHGARVRLQVDLQSLTASVPPASVHARDTH